MPSIQDSSIQSTSYVDSEGSETVLLSTTNYDWIYGFTTGLTALFTDDVTICDATIQTYVEDPDVPACNDVP